MAKPGRPVLTPHWTKPLAFTSSRVAAEATVAVAQSAAPNMSGSSVLFISDRLPEGLILVARMSSDGRRGPSRSPFACDAPPRSVHDAAIPGQSRGQVKPSGLGLSFRVSYRRVRNARQEIVMAVDDAGHARRADWN